MRTIINTSEYAMTKLNKDEKKAVQNVFDLIYSLKSDTAKEEPVGGRHRKVFIINGEPYTKAEINRTFDLMYDLLKSDTIASK